MYVGGLAPSGATALVGEEDYSGTGIIVPRRDQVPPMLRYLGVNPDIAFIVSNSPTHARASAYGTSDDDARAGDAFAYDGHRMYHRYFHLVPGMTAMHSTSSALTAAHEFGHAFSSYSNGFITDLYVDSPLAFNNKIGRRIPTTFATYKGRGLRVGQGARWPGLSGRLVLLSSRPDRRRSTCSACGSSARSCSGDAQRPYQ